MWHNPSINRKAHSRLRRLRSSGYFERYAPHGIQSELRYSAPLFAPARQFAWRLSGNTKNTERKGMRGPLVLWRAASHRAAGQSSCVCERRPPVRWRSAHQRWHATGHRRRWPGAPFCVVAHQAVSRPRDHSANRSARPPVGRLRPAQPCVQADGPGRPAHLEGSSGPPLNSTLARTSKVIAYTAHEEDESIHQL